MMESLINEAAKGSYQLLGEAGKLVHKEEACR